MTGKDEWRLIHVQNGILTDSKISKPAGPGGDKQPSGPNGFVGEQAGLGAAQNPTQGAGVPNQRDRRRASDGANGTMPGPALPGSDPAGGQNNGVPPLPGQAPDNGQNQNQLPGTQTQSRDGAARAGTIRPFRTDLSRPADFPSAARNADARPAARRPMMQGQQGVPGMPGMPGMANNRLGATPGASSTSSGNSFVGGGSSFVGGGTSYVGGGAVLPDPSRRIRANPPIPGQPLPGLPGAPVNSQTGGVSPYPTQPGANGTPPGFPQPGTTTGQGNPAADMIRNILTTPRPGGMPQANPGGQTIGGGIAGVASKAEGEGVKVYNDHTLYEEWEFIFDPAKVKQIPNPNATGAGGTPPTA